MLYGGIPFEDCRDTFPGVITLDTKSQGAYRRDPLRFRVDLLSKDFDEYWIGFHRVGIYDERARVLDPRSEKGWWVG